MLSIFQKKRTPKHAHSAIAVANCFILLARKELKLLTNIQVHKLVYIANGYALALLDRPLYSNPTEAWKGGPIIPDLYYSLAKYGAGPVTNIVYSKDEIEPNSDEMEIIEGVYESYGQWKDFQLSSITHQPGTPWDITYRANPGGSIEPALIQAKYKEKIEAGEMDEKEQQQTATA